jgi:hypothetical protein
MLIRLAKACDFAGIDVDHDGLMRQAPPAIGADEGP